MARYFIFLEYKGTAYHGWQVQPGRVTVQGSLEQALSTALRQKLEVTGAGRTDTGVHARAFVAHFDIDQLPLPPDKLVFSLNGILPDDISVSRIREVKPGVHARFTALSRTYRYYITGRKDPFSRDTATFLPGSPDIGLMNSAAEILRDYNDFTSFSKLHTDVKTNNCTIMSALWSEENDMLVFEITADRFLRNMVRAIVGTMLDIGLGKHGPGHIRSVIEARDRSAAGRSVPPGGLFLTRIEYPGDIYVS